MTAYTLIGSTSKMPRGGKAISDSSIRALERGVAVLQAVNRLHGAKPGDIAEYTGIPRPSVYRLLKTLAEMGMVSKDHFSNRWRPTRHVKSLSSGFREEDWVCQVAVPHMIQLGRDVLWPLDLMTLRGYHMEVRESTHQISPYSVQHGMVGKQVPLIETASGRVLLANMADPDRQALLNLFSEATGQKPPFITRDGVLETLLAKVRKLGVGIRSADFTPETGSISAPIWYEDRVFACLTLIWSTSSLSLEKSLLLYREKLLQTADAISRDLVGNLTSAEIAQFREAS
ncbi:MAG: helix-turn-helix domain-containing protein [Sagittula sp.]|uniref:helix-turn-helix domain-containing protein n=1 Tax=Sagittula sp. TaxID=2038081 RepID=UPI004059A20A